MRVIQLTLLAMILIIGSVFGDDSNHRNHRGHSNRGLPDWVGDLEESVTKLSGKVDELDQVSANLRARIEELEAGIPAPLVLALSPPNFSTIDATSSITMRFSDSMDIATLQLSGEMAIDEWETVLSSTIRLGDTLTIKPISQWTPGPARILDISINSIAGASIAQLPLSYTIQAQPPDPIINGDFRECSYMATAIPPITLQGWTVESDGSWNLNNGNGEMSCEAESAGREGVVFFGQDQGGWSADRNTLSQTITIPTNADRIEVNGSNTRWGTYPNQYNARLEVYIDGTRVGGPSQGNDFTISADIQSFRGQTVVVSIVRPRTTSWSQIWLDWVRIVPGP